MVASQSVEPQQQQQNVADMYCSPVHSHYGEYYPDSHYYMHAGAPAELCSHVCTIQSDYGPVTVPMVSTNSSPPIAMPVQVPQGHVVQQIVDESGTLRHVILSPQHPASLVPLPSHNHQPYNTGPANGTNQPQPPFYHSLPTGFPPQHFHSNMQPGHPVPSPTHLGHSPPPNATTYYKDERTQKQHIKLKKKLYDKQQKVGGGSGAGAGGVGGGPAVADNLTPRNGLKRATGVKDKGMNSVGTSEDGEESSVPDEDDIQLVADILSSVQAPKVSELSSRSALLQWASPSRLSESGSNDSHEVNISESDLRYEVLLSDKSKEMKFKSIYNGTSLSCRIQDLKPGQEYSVCLQVHFDNLQGSATDPIKFTTPPCEPDQPQAPKVINRTRNSLQLRWNAVNNNGSDILHYVLEYADGQGGEWQEQYKNLRGKQHILQKLQPGTNYRFRLAAVNSVGTSAYSETVMCSTLDNPPLQPAPPILVESDVHSLHLQWERRPRDDIFILQMNDLRTKYGHMNVYNGNQNYYVCQNLTHFSDYTFRLRAQNESGMSHWSDEITYRTLPDRPARPSKPLVKGRIHAHSFKLKWEAPADCGGAAITRYVLEVNSGSGYEMVYSGNETEAVCDKLTPGTTYQLRVSCVSDGGSSNYSDPCTVTTDAISPGQCAQPRLHGKPKFNTIGVRWSEPDYNGGAPVLEYEVQLSDAINRTIVKCKETECLISSDELIKPGCSYAINVRAVNRIGPGNWSDALEVVSGAAPPFSPDSVALHTKSPFHIAVEWAEPQSNGSPISDYRLEMSVATDEHFSQIYHGVQASYEAKNLLPFTRYYFRVQACNSAGCSGFSATAETLTPAAPPATVTSLRSVSRPTSITLQWSHPADNGSSITHYNIEIGDRDKLISTESPMTEYTIEALQPESQYKIKIQAVNAVAAGSFSSTLRTGTLKLPPVAPRLECIGIGHNYLKLKWGDGKNTDYTQYCVEMENVRSHEFQCVYKGTAFSCKVNKLHEMTAYRFRINASNDAGVGEHSKEYEFSTSISPPGVLKMPKVVEVEQRGCVVDWMPAKNTFSDPIVYLLQISRLKEQNFAQVYKGSDTKFSVDHLDPGVEYSARVCPVRLCESSELTGPFSPVVNFTTLAAEQATSSAKSIAPKSHHVQNRGSWYHTVRTMKPPKLSVQAMLSLLIIVVGIVLSLIIKLLLEH